MKTISVIKQEAREEFERLIDEETKDAGECGILNILDFHEETLNTFADRLVDEIEKVVDRGEDLDGLFSWSHYRRAMLESLARFKGESV